MNPSDRTRGWADTVLLWATSAAVLYLTIIAFNSHSWPILALKVVAGRELPKQIVTLQEMDREALNAVVNSGASGNVVADLRSAPSVIGTERDYLATFYSRAVFTLWPRRMYVSYPSTVINSGKQIDAAPRPNDRMWLMQHNVGAAVRFDLQEN